MRTSSRRVLIAILLLGVTIFALYYESTAPSTAPTQEATEAAGVSPDARVTSTPAIDEVVRTEPEGSPVEILVEPGESSDARKIEFVFLRAGTEVPVENVRLKLRRKASPNRDVAGQAQQGPSKLEVLADGTGKATVVAPSGEYSWAVASKHFLRLRPGQAGAVPAGKSLVVSTGDSNRVVFDVLNGVVRAQLLLPAAEIVSIDARVFDLRAEGAKAEQSQLVERYVKTKDGSLVIEGLSEGHKRLGATVKTAGAPQRISYYSAVFDLAHGEEKDLGEIAPRQGNSIDGRVALMDERGQELSIAEVFGGSADSFRPIIEVSSNSYHGHDVGNLEVIEIAGDAPFAIDGLPADTYAIRAYAGFGPMAEFSPNGYFVRDGLTTRAVAPSSGVVVRIQVARTVDVVFRAAWGGEPPIPINITVYSDGDRSMRKLRYVDVSRDFPAKLPEGTYRFLATPLNETDQDKNLVAVSSANVAGRTEILLRFVKGAVVLGNCSKRGVPMANRYIGFGPVDWTDAGGNPLASHVVRTDEAGAFMCTSVPPNTKMTWTMRRHEFTSPDSAGELRLTLNNK